MKNHQSLATIIILIGLLTTPSLAGDKLIPKGKHIVWHDGGAEYFAVFENGMLYSLHIEDNSYQKIYKVKDKALIESLFKMAESQDFIDMHPPLNREEVLHNDKDYKHIELRREGRKYEVYWSDKDDSEEPEFLAELLVKLMELV